MQSQPLWDQMVAFFGSAFLFPGLHWTQVVLAIGLGLAFGAIWLVVYRPPLTDKLGLLALAAVSAFLTWTAIAFLQAPLQAWWEQALLTVWSQSTVLQWVLLAGIPTVLITGLVQEGAKLVPVLVYRSRRPGGFDARTGLLIGAVSGAAFGVFEAVWVHNTNFAAGIPWQTFQSDVFASVSPFVERFFAVGFHAGMTALVGYGLATGRGWRFYLLAAGIHGLGNYVAVLVQAGILDGVAALVYIAVLTISLSWAVLRLRSPLDKERAHAGRQVVPIGTGV